MLLGRFEERPKRRAHADGSRGTDHAENFRRQIGGKIIAQDADRHKLRPRIPADLGDGQAFQIDRNRPVFLGEFFLFFDEPHDFIRVHKPPHVDAVFAVVGHLQIDFEFVAVGVDDGVGQHQIADFHLRQKSARESHREHPARRVGFNQSFGRPAGFWRNPSRSPPRPGESHRTARPEM